MEPDPLAPEAPSAVRRERIGRHVESSGFASVTDLAAIVDVSVVTVRSDLEALAAAGRIERVRGGAMAVRERADERPFEIEAASAIAEKRSIAALAASMVVPGQSVILDVGTTTAAIAKALADRQDLHDVTIVTNGLAIALELERAIPRFTVVVTGGTLRPLQHSLVEPLASDLFGRMHADLAFIGCTGVDGDGGVTNVNLPEAVLKRAMLQAAERGIVVADSSKLGRVDFGRVGGLSEFDCLITDEGRASEPGGPGEPDGADGADETDAADRADETGDATDRSSDPRIRRLREAGFTVLLARTGDGFGTLVEPRIAP